MMTRMDGSNAPTPVDPSPATGFTRGGPRALLRVEGAVVLLAAVLAYARLGAGWGLFAALFLVPDASFLGYLAGPRWGALAYNAAHSYLGPFALGLVAYLGLGVGSVGLAVALVWGAHVGFDRMLGYGLKYASGFRHTHLGELGGARLGAATSLAAKPSR